MQRRSSVGLVLWCSTVLGSIACDGWLFGSDGPDKPRLSASLAATAPSSPTYTARIRVKKPEDREYVAVVAEAGASISLAGGASSVRFCAPATEEQLYEVATVPGTPHLLVYLGKWSADAGLPAIGPGSACASSDPFGISETLVVNIPSASMDVAPDAGVDTEDAPVEEEIDAGDVEPAVDAAAPSDGGEL